MKAKKLISLITAASLVMSLFTSFAVKADSTKVYTCDFTQLVKDGADTYYGSEADIIALDDYTTAYLTYSGTYVGADAKVYLQSGGITNGAGKFALGSYIAFTAPSDGTVAATGNRIGYCIGTADSNEYISYGSTISYDLQEGQTLFMGARGNTYIQSLSFTPDEKAQPTPSPTADTNQPTREILYSDDFEGCTVGTNGGWTSPAGTMAVKSDTSTAGIGQYQTVVSGKSGTCRSGYIEIPTISDNFVFECDFKSTSNVNVSDLELLEAKGSVYANHGRYSNAKYALTLARPKGSDLYVINNASDDSGLTLDRYTQPAVTSSEISGNPWLHIKAVGNFDTHTIITTITSLDKSITYYYGMTDMSPDISSWKCIHLLSPSTGADTCIDNIVVSKATESDLAPVFHTVTINNGISSFSQYVADGGYAANIPDMSLYGKHFLGWSISGDTKLYTSEQLKSQVSINADCEITASISGEYVENLASVEFNSFPGGGLLSMGADGDTYADNEISLTILGERGTSLVSKPDARVGDYKIDWTISGFRTLGGAATSDSGFTYCDSYGLCEITQDAQSKINFRLKNTSANYYGLVTATVTYNGKTVSVSKPLVLLGDAAANSSVLLPKSGYCADFGKYEDTLTGYTAQSDDILLGGWSSSGSDSGEIRLTSENGGKFLSLSRNLTGNSYYIYNTIGDLTAQTVFSQDVRFGSGATISYGTGKAVTEFSSTAFELGFTDSALTLNGTQICTADKNKWYHIEICAEPTSKQCFARVYALRADTNYSSAEPIGTTDALSFKDGYTSGAYYRISLAKEKGGVDINNVTISMPQVASAEITAPQTADIPESGTSEVALSVSAKADDGSDVLSEAVWSIADELAEDVSIAQSGTHTAVLTIGAGAASGDLTVKATINGYSVIKTIKLLGTEDNIAFTTAPTGVMIPVSSGATYAYSAEVRGGNAEVIPDRTVTYALYNSDNTAPLSADGISISDSGILSVASSAQPQTIYVRALSANSGGGTIERAVKVSVYNLKFDFGSDAAKSGYTAVSADTEYTDSRGFGITGVATDSGTTLTGSDFGFNVKLEKGNVYNIALTFKGTVKCEKINNKFTGFEKTNASLGEITYTAAVFGDDILDITFSGSGELDCLTIEKVDRQQNAKPSWWTIGDSTVQQNGSWAYTIASSSTTDLSAYPLLANAVGEFHNSGRAGRQHISYYTEGLLNNLLCGIRPGDVVSISGMGTNDSSSSKNDFKSYNDIYINAIEDMGAYVILGSYTPTGNYGATDGKVFDSDNLLFKGMRTDLYDAAIREVYAERAANGDDKILGFIDIGKIADIMMTNDVRTAYNLAADSGKTSTEARAAAEERAAEMMAWWKDYNHYYSTFSSYILPEITARAAQLISGGEQSALPEIITLHEAVEPEKLIEILSTSADSDYIYIKIAGGFDGIAAAALYSADKELLQTVITADNGAAQTIKLNIPDEPNCTIKLMNWSNMRELTPLSSAQTISVDDIVTIQPKPVTVEAVSSDEYVDVSSLVMYGSTDYRMYKSDGSYQTVKAENGKVHNTTGGEVIVVPEYKFEFTNQTNPTDEHIKGYVKVAQGSYTADKGYGLTSESYNINANGCAPVSGRPIKADVPSGYYDIEVYRIGGCRADIYSEGVQIMNNTTSSGSQNRPSGSAVMFAPSVNIESGADITFGNTQGSNERIASVKIVRVPEKFRKPTVWIAGDSEAANYFPIDQNGNDLDSNKIMMTGFGMQLGKFLSDKYAVANWGQPSATAGTWNSECLAAVSQRMQSGDTILIDFGINDAVSSSNKVDLATLKANITAIVDAAKAKNVTPILMSPVYNGKYQHKSYFTYNEASNTNALADFAKELGVSFIDINRYTQLYVNNAIAETGDANWRTNNYHVGDNLHLTQHSALLTASIICAHLKQLGYETSDYSYTYNDLSALDASDSTLRGTLSGTTRVYSVDEATKFIAKNADPEEVFSQQWSFDTNPSQNAGANVPIIGGTASWNEANQNIKFDASTKTSGTLDLTLDPSAKSDIVRVSFDLNVGALGQQTFAYDIKDDEGNSLSSISFDVYNATGALTLGGQTVAEGSTFTKSIASARGDGMSASATSFANEFNFADNTVTVTIGSDKFTGTLTGAETKSVRTVKFTSSRSKTADRHIYLDNLAVKGYKAFTADDENATAFTDFKAELYTAGSTALPYRIYSPEGDNLPVVLYLHSATRKGSDNESQLYNAQYLFDAVSKSESAILIAPQCPQNSSWKDLLGAVEGLVGTIENADTDRIYIAGYGEGADACYDLLASGKFAAAVSIGGSGDVSKAQAIADIKAAVLAVNSSADDTNARNMIKTLTSLGAKNAEYAEAYGEVGNIQEYATELGAADWMLSHSITSNSADELKVVDLAIFMGQSNMAGRGSYKDATQVPVGHGYEFRSVTQPDMLFNITGPFGKLENNTSVNDNSGSGTDRRSGDMVSSIMESYFQKTGTPIVGVQCSRGGTNTGYWNGAAVKAEAQARLGAAKTYLEDNGYTIGHIFMVWCQGESDGDKINSGSQTADGYKSATLSVFNYMKSVGVEDMFIVKTGHYNGSDDESGAHDAAYVTINEAQQALADSNDHIHAVASLLEYQSQMIDSYHFNQTAYNEVGTTAGAAIADVYAD